MLRYLRKRKAQSTIEYAVLIVIIIGALLSIQVYIKRSIQGRLKQAADDIGDQYSPGNTNYQKTTTTSSVTTESFVDGEQMSEISGQDTTNVTTNMYIYNQQQEYWGSETP